MEYLPIENYGVIGDQHTVALVGLNGSVDFMCFPEFDSPTIFAALLDHAHGGRFSITPRFGEMKTKQLYLPDTNVLLTRFLSTEGVGEIMDFMPAGEPGTGRMLIRRVTNVRGKVDYRMRCGPRFNYARSAHSAFQVSPTEILLVGGQEDTIRIRLRSTVPMSIEGNDVCADFTLGGNESVDFLLEEAGSETGDSIDLREFVTGSLFRTINYWKAWTAQSAYNGRWREIVNRSALVLKLLTSCRYGSILAAATFGLPESVGGGRNWDYRYTWIRDASFTVYAFISLGYVKEAEAFMRWIEKLCRDSGEGSRLGIMYAANGTRRLEEKELDHLSGYRGSRPVRVGNNAFEQLQLDIYGELLDAVWLFNQYGEPISHDFWKSIARQVEWLTANWNQPDEGIWEVRGGKKEFLYSRLMSWVAFDRAIRIAEQRSFPFNREWYAQRDHIYNSIFEEFWDEEAQTFVQYKGSRSIDASLLLMPLLNFIGPKDPRWLSTLKKIEEVLVSDSLVYRYKPMEAAADGINTHEGTFSMCTFWYVECLSRSGQLEKARFCFEKMIGYANHVGLYAEQLGFEGEHLGNFPQAFTHLGLISAALNLDRQLNDRRNRNAPEPY